VSRDPVRLAIYLLVLLSLAGPLIFKVTLPPVRMPAAEKFFNAIENVDPQSPGMALVALEWAAGTLAESGSQSDVLIEHLMLRKIKFAVMTLVPQSEPLLTSVPEKIAARVKSFTGYEPRYGVDWINLGYRPGAAIAIRSMADAKDLATYFKKDTLGNSLIGSPFFDGVKTIKDLKGVFQISSMQGLLEYYIQFLQKDGVRPLYLHGCTSISVPQAYIYLDSGQMNGLLEGISGAAWYDKIMQDRYPDRPVSDAQLINTGLGAAQLVVLFLILVGNIVGLLSRRGA
jgi:hypothetical protein